VAIPATNDCWWGDRLWRVRKSINFVDDELLLLLFSIENSWQPAQIRAIKRAIFFIFIISI
jgi:hypothetical protein